MTNTGKEELTD